MISKNIAYYIDAYKGIFTFATTAIGEKYYTYLIDEVVKNLTCKSVKLDFDSDNDDAANYKDTLLILDLTTAKPDKFYVDRIARICDENNNVLLIKKLTYKGISSLGTDTVITPSFLLYSATVAFTIDDNSVIKVIKNRYDSIDIINHNIIAYMREERINQILED